MQRLGHEVWPIHTVQFSNHTGYGSWRGQVFDAALIDDCVAGIADRGVLGSCDGVLSGYMGTPETGEAILRAVGRVRSLNAKAAYACDPVIGDVGRGVFVRPGVPEFMRDRAMPVADLVTPNQFELEYLTGRSSSSLAEAKTAVAALHGLGPKVVLVTSLFTEATPEGSLDALASDGKGVWLARSPKLPLEINGAGDAIAALFYVHWLTTGSPAEALSRAMSSVFGLLRRTAEAGSREILTVAAQDEIVSPTMKIAAIPV
jgi:pyridoxine kinase